MSDYLDYNASSPIDPRVLDVMNKCYLEYYGNADSRTHSFGENVRKQVENSRKKIATLLNVKTDEIIFTSGATESNNIAVLGLREYAEKTNKKHIITTAIEHKAILESVKYLETQGFDIDFIYPNQSGKVDVEDVISKIKDTTLLISVMHVNNETGVIQPVKELGEYLKGKDIYFHIDATQSCGKLVEEIQQLTYDMMSISSHKMAGPQGIGALIMKKRNYKSLPLKPIMFGGPQEKGIRPGTLPTALIVGFGRAAELSLEEYKSTSTKCKKIKKILLDLLEQSGLNYHINGDLSDSIDTTLNVSFPGISSEALMISTRQYCGVSNGSACNSKSYKPSHVLSAMQLDDELLESAIRISWGKFSNTEEIQYNFQKLLETAKNFI